MKKLYTAIAVCALALSVGVAALAQGKMEPKGSKKGDCCSSTKGDATPEQIRKFKADTIDLRQEMMNKRFDLQREGLKEAPDSAKIDALKAEVTAVKAKIEAVRESSKLPDSVCQKVCQMMDEDGSNCNKAGSCGCKQCQNGKSCSDCSSCKDGSCKGCNKATSCKNCDKTASCDCSKDGGTCKCSKKGKAGCKGNCNTKK